MRKSMIHISAIATVLLMVFCTMPLTAGAAPGYTNVYEIGTDIQKMPPERSGLFLPFMKYEIGYGPGSRGMFLYRASLLQDYGLDSAGKITQISFRNMWGDRIYDHPDAGPQFAPGESEFLNFEIRMGLTTNMDVNATYAYNYDVAGPVTVYFQPGWHTITGTHMNWMNFLLSTSFDYDGASNLVIEYDWDGISGYNMGLNYGGSWNGIYANLNGNLMTGLFSVGYTGISWSSYANVDTGYLFGPPDEDHIPVLRIEGEFTIPATIDVDPNTLNLKSRGKWITTYIELPKGGDVNDIDVSTVKISRIDGVQLATPIYAEAHPTSVGDEDSDGIPDRMVKFSRPAVQEVVEGGDTEITVTGKLTTGQAFEGSDTILVIHEGYSGGKHHITVAKPITPKHNPRVGWK